MVYLDKRSGEMFTVYVLEDVVIKFPNKRPRKKILDIIKIHEDLESLSFIPPVWTVKHEDILVLIQRRAPGESIKEIGKLSYAEANLYKLFKQIVCESALRLNYKAGNLSASNIYYDRKTGSFSLVDIHSFEKI